MSDLRLAWRSAVDPASVGSGFHAHRSAAQVALAPRNGLAIASVIARVGRQEALAHHVRAAFDLDLPTTPRHAGSKSLSFVWVGPSQWLVVAENLSNSALERSLLEAVKGNAAVVDQSGGYFIVRVSGARARDALAKGVPIDLHPSAFSVDDAASTAVVHMAVHFWQTSAEPAYDFAIPTSFAAAFWNWLCEVGAEFGITVSESC